MKYTKEEFIKIVETNNKEKYDFRYVPNIVSPKDRVRLISLSLDVKGEIIGEYNQVACKIMKGQTSRKFANKQKSIGKEAFIEQVSKLYPEYDFSITEYTTIWDKVKYVCPKHGVIETTAHHLKQGHGCKYCSKEKADEDKRYKVETLITKLEEIHGSNLIFDKSKINYINNRTPIIVTCPKHGDIKVIPSNLLKGCGCRLCSVEQRTKTEQDVYEYLKENFNDAIHGYKNKKLLGKLQIDVFIPSKNTAIEVQGEQHFRPIEFFGGEKSFVKQLERDERKRQLCEEHGIKLLYYSNLGIEYPYKVYEDKEELLNEIKK